MATLADALQEILQKSLPQPQNTGVGPTIANQQALLANQVPLANQAPAQPVQPQVPVIPQQAPIQLPAMPNLAQYANAGSGGFKGFLKDTLAEIIPAATQVAIWGPGEFGQKMAYNKLTSHLAKKKADEEKQKLDMISQLATGHAGMRKYLKDTGGDPDMYWYALTKPGTSTGNPQVDSWIQQMQPEIKQLIDSGKLGASDMLTSFEKARAWEDLTKEEGVLSEKAFKQQVKLSQAKQRPNKPKHEVGDVRTILGEGGSKYQETFQGYGEDGNQVWGNRTKNVARPNEQDYSTPQSQYAGVDPVTGQPLAFMPERGGPGKIVPIPSKTGQVAPKLKTPSNEIITTQQQINTLKETLDKSKILYKPEYVGPIAGRVAGAKEVTVGLSKEQAIFNSELAQLSNTLIYLMSGKQINEQEYNRLRKQLPDKNLPSSVFEARIVEFERTLNSIISEREKGMSGYVGNKTTNKPDPLGLR